MKVAVVGCSHGSLDEIYRLIDEIERERNCKIELLLICGDFQSLRNPADLRSIAMPEKFFEMGTFHKYYSGSVNAPVLTVFIGGNHEASNYLQELPFGGWVAPNIYYMGLAGVVRFGGLRIAGLSGIFKSGDFGRGHYENLPFSEHEKRSIYHVRSLELFRLKLLDQSTERIDIFLSHDWPRGITSYGNVQELLRWKPFFRQDIEAGVLGSPPAEELLNSLKPRHHFAGHMHCRFAACVKHSQGDMQTLFLALDKVLPRRKFLEVVDIEPLNDVEKPLQLTLDPEWLAILKSTAALWSYNSGFTQLPTKQETIDAFRPSKEQLQTLIDDFSGEFQVPENFEPTAPVYGEPHLDTRNNWRAFQANANRYHIEHYLNPQTALLCQMLDIENPNVEWGHRAAKRGLRVVQVANQEEATAYQSPSVSKAGNPDEIKFDDDFDNVDQPLEVTSGASISNANPDEILVSFDDDGEDAPESIETEVKRPKITSS